MDVLEFHSKRRPVRMSAPTSPRRRSRRPRPSFEELAQTRLDVAEKQLAFLLAQRIVTFNVFTDSLDKIAKQCGWIADRA